MDKVDTRSRKTKKPALLSEDRLLSTHDSIRGDLPKKLDELHELVAYHGGVGQRRSGELLEKMLAEGLLIEHEGFYFSKQDDFWEKIAPLLPVQRHKIQGEMVRRHNYSLQEKDILFLLQRLESEGLLISEKGEVRVSNTRKVQLQKPFQAPVESVQEMKGRKAEGVRGNQASVPAKKKSISKKKAKIYKLDLHKLLQSMPPNMPMTTQSIAMALSLDFSRGSDDRAALSWAINELLDNHMITEIAGGKFIKRSSVNFDSKNDPIGVLFKNGDRSYIQPSDSNLPRYYIGYTHHPDQSMVSYQITEDKFENRATITHDHGILDEQTGASDLTALEFDIPREFPEDVLEEVIGMTVPKISSQRRDFRKIPFITIDPETAKDFDDAICARKRGKNMVLYVAIADVEHYVRAGTRLFEEAYKRGTSVYFPGRTIPMIPEALSNGLCSLKPNEDRACIMATYVINEKGEIIKETIERGLMRSRARLTYEQVDAAMSGDAPKNVMSIYNKYIVKAHEAYKRLLKEREIRGALDLGVRSQHIDISLETGVTVKLDQYTPSHGIIEEFMIGANRVANKKLRQKNLPLFSRVHGEPNAKALDAIVPTLEKMGIDVKADLPIGERVKDILEQAKLSKYCDKIRRAMIRVQGRAGYQVASKGHYGLGLTAEGDGYSHFTSPIRRFSDLIVHSLLMKRTSVNQSFFAHENLEEVAKHINMTEQRAEDAERKCRERYVASWVADNLSKIFNATVTNVLLDSNEIEVRVDGRSIYTTLSVKNVKDYEKNNTIQIKPTKADKISGLIEFKIVSSNEHENDNAQSGTSSCLSKPKLRVRTKKTRYRGATVT